MITQDLMADVLRWLVPALIVFGATAVVVVAIGWAVRAARRSPRARTAASAARTRAGADLVTLDDAVAELDLEVGLSGALYGGNPPPTLRRGRLTAQHMRDEAFERFRALDDPHLLPPQMERAAHEISRKVAEALRVIGRSSAEHQSWISQNSSAAGQVASAQARLRALREQMGDPSALVRDLQARFDQSEWADAATAAAAAVTDADQAQRLLERAATEAADPSRSALADLALAERHLRTAQVQAERLDEIDRTVQQAVEDLPDEIEAARHAIRQATLAQESLEPVDAQRLSLATREASETLQRLEQETARTPTRASAGVARLREKLDLARTDARTAQQRLHGARTALPGTMAAARAAVSRAQAAASGAGADARVRLAAAQEELAKARQLSDPVASLDAARRAMRHAEDAQALAGYDRMTQSR